MTGCREEGLIAGLEEVNDSSPKKFLRGHAKALRFSGELLGLRIAESHGEAGHD